MDVDDVMRAVIRSFHDAGLRVELVPKSQSPTRATTAVGNSQPRPRSDSSAQAVDGQYVSVYRVQHCKVTPTSPPPTTTEFPPQRAELSYGCDNFQVGGDGSGATGKPNKSSSYRGGLSWSSRDAVYSPRYSYRTDAFASSLRKYPSHERSAETFEELLNWSRSAVCDDFQVGGDGSGATGKPNKSSSYRGGLSWSSRDGVYSSRDSYRTDAFASSLRKYPSHDRSAETFWRLLNLSRSAGRSPVRSYTCPARRDHNPGTRHRNPKTYEDRLVYSMNDGPTRDKAKSDATFRPQGHFYKSESISVLKRRPLLRRKPKQTQQKQIAKPDYAKNVLKESRRLRNNPKSISSCVRTHSSTACTDGHDVWSYEWYTHTPFQGRSEDDHKPNTMLSHPVNTHVQAVASKISQEVETVPLPIPIRRTIATPLTPVPSFPELSIQTHDLPAPSITRSNQIFIVSSTSVGTTTSSVEINLAKVIAKKSKSLSDFRLKRDFKNEILDWLDDISDPKIMEVQEMVLKNLNCRLKKTRVPETERIKVRIGNCVKSRWTKSSEPSNMINKQQEACHNVHENMSAEVNSMRYRSDFEDVIKQWLSNIHIKKCEAQIPVKQDQIFNILVNRLKNLVVIQSKHFREQLLREKIMKILKEVPIEVNSHDRIHYLDTLTDDLMYRLENIKRDHSEIKPFKFNKPEKLNEYLPFNHFQHTDKETMNFELQAMVDVLKKRNMMHPDLVKEVIIGLVDILKDSACSNARLEEITTLLHNATKLPENEVLQHAMKLTNLWRETLSKKYTNPANFHQFTVFMVQNQNLSENNIFKSSGTEMSQNSIGSSVDNIEVNVNQYKIQLGKQIGRWITDFPILKTHDKDFKQAAVLDLASDIVDRQKYLNFSKNRGSDMDELEHLKYQIFKWIKRLVGEENMEILGHAAELMKMIRSVPVPMLTKSRDQVCQSNSGLSSNDRTEPRNSVIINNNHISRSQPNFLQCYHVEAHNGPVFTNFIVHKISDNKPNSSKQRRKGGQTPSSNTKKDTTVNKSNINTESSSSNHCASNQKNVTDSQNVIYNNENQSINTNGVEHTNQGLWTSGLVTPMPTSGQKASSAAAKLMADWRPPPIFTPPPPGRLGVDQVQEEFQEYLKNWSQQIPIPVTTPDEIKVAEKARLGILKGIWKMITKIKTQPAVFQNKFYYEDVLGKEIDELLDCLPQSQELKEKRYTLKAQLLEKTTNVNELVRELETPDNYKAIAQNQIEKENVRNRKVVKLVGENPSKMFEQMFIYCTLDDFLSRINYENNDKVKDKAYKIKLLKNIQAYIDELKTTHGKEIEDLFNVVSEDDIMRILYNVPLPSDETVKENADEIFLGLEIEQWMMDLPIIKNDDATEQRHRRRLTDSLTKKLLKMEKSVRVTSCCEDTRVRQEISFFLDKVPLEEDQDLNINEMVDELTNRLKNRQPCGREKPVFQNGQQNQQRTNGLSRLLDQSLYTTKWKVGEDEDAQYKAFFKTEPLCSTRIELPVDEWEMKEGHAAQYRALFKDRPVSSSMIEPQAYGMDMNSGGYAPILTDFQQPYEREPYFAYAPGQFQESARGGSFGIPLQGLLPCSDIKFQYPESSVMHQHGQSPQMYYDSNGNLANFSLRDSQYQSIPGVDTRQSISPRSQSIIQPTPYTQPRVLDWEGQNEASGGFVSLIDHAPQPPVMNEPKQNFSNVHRQSHKFNQSRIDTNEPLNAAPVGLLSSNQNRRTLIDTHPPRAFVPDASLFSREAPKQSRRNSVEFESNIMRRESLDMSNARSHRDPDPDLLQLDPGEEAGFVSMISHQSLGAAQAPPAHLQTTVRNQSLRQRINQSNRFAEHQRAPIVETAPEPLPENADPEGIQQMINQSRCANTSTQNIQASSYRAQDALSRSIRNASLRQSSPMIHEAASHPPASSQRIAPSLPLASNIASTEISNQPVFFSTPNQRPDNSAPPNIRQRRQMERDNASVRGLFAEKEEGEDRCHCVERFRRWHSQGGTPNCSTCDDCVHSRNPHFFYSYPYPLPYPYPSHVKPPPPPYCRR